MRDRWVRQMVVGGLAVVATLALAVGVQAQTKRIPLMADPKWSTAGKASGELVITRNGGQAELTLTAKGLRAEGVYSVWFVNMQPQMQKAGVGQAPYAFTAKRNGQGTYKTAVSAADLEKWQVVFIVRHPDGNPQNMQQMEDALMGKLMP
ncbi:MAG: hypothetical protein HYV08_09960 [Deltaproteobacteria bacterium]|nr:hypothetical protein [Deltaproteobacteria bacterium]